jgi:hypothetical protein
MRIHTKSSVLARLAALSTCPIQYYIPLFRGPTARDVLKVYVLYRWESPSMGDHVRASAWQ